MSERYQPIYNIYNDGASMSHISRYLLARGFLDEDDEVLDMACGTGYGTRLLAQRAAMVTGVDKNSVFPENNEFLNYGFIQANISEMDQIEVDALVCLETIEHLENPKIILDYMDKNVKRKFIVSSPDKDTRQTNPDHKSNVSLNILLEMMRDYPEWTLYQVFYQDVYYIAIFVRKTEKLINL